LTTFHMTNTRVTVWGNI